MAVYKQIGGTEHKFTSTKSITVRYDPALHKLGNIEPIKVITDNTVHYLPLVPIAGEATSDPTSFEVFSYKSVLGDSSGGTYCVYMDTNIVPKFTVSASYKSCLIDDMLYRGPGACRYGIYELAVDHVGYGSGTCAISSGWYVPKCIVRVLKYVAETETMDVIEIDSDRLTLSRTVKMDSYDIAMIIAGVELTVNKAEDDIVLAVTFEYPKHDIQFAGSTFGLEYSLDDGVTYRPVTTGLKVEQIEHILFRNVGNGNLFIGTSEGGADLATIAPGATKLMIPPEDCVWYILGGAG